MKDNLEKSNISKQKTIITETFFFQFMKDQLSQESKQRAKLKNGKGKVISDKTPKLIINVKCKHQRVFAINYMLSYVINKIEANNCYQHSYLIFYIPAILVIAEHLSMYQDQKELQSFKLLITLIKRIQFVKQNYQINISEEQLINYITVALNYRNVKVVKITLKQYLQKNIKKMMGFMPVYALYFDLLSKKQELLSEGARLSDAINLIKKTELQFKKYNNENI